MIRKTQILTWLVVLLVIMNAVTIGTILYHNYQENQRNDNIAINTGTDVNMLNGRFFRQTLGFNNEQMNAFREINHVFRPQAMSLTARIDSLKNEMFAELQKPESDTAQLNVMAKQIGDLHGQLKHEIYQFYLALKVACSQKQRAELGEVFLPLFKNEGITSPPNKQGRRGWNRN